ncbi:hypothetical protein VKT23_006767 [Stygiomarasmius scandens]|uniref:Uncharacterized protein n=1 Tax=Marasmiellus scandens TaxID=2682957 RepID=A0ABR1JM32_9AGAR
MGLDGLITIRAAFAEQHFIDESEAPLSSSPKIVLHDLIEHAVATRKSVNAGLFAAAMSQAISPQEMLNLMLTGWTKLEMASISLERSLEYCNLDPEEDGNEGGCCEPDMEWPTRGEIEVVDVVAKYADVPVLKGVSLHVAPGSSLGLCGHTGSGKR